MYDEDFRSRIDDAPDAAECVRELIAKARGVSESRFFLTILDFQTERHQERNYLTFLDTRHWVIQQFAEYLNSVIDSVNEQTGLNETNLGRRLQLLAYSQFWECLGIQRLLLQLGQVANNQQYDSRLLLDKREFVTYKVYKKIRARCRLSGLQAYDFLTIAYNNQIRNAFVHSDFWMQVGLISLENHIQSKAYSIPSIRYETWSALFEKTLEFIKALFLERRTIEMEIESLAPYTVDLPEFAGPFTLSKDDRGHWTAKTRR